MEEKNRFSKLLDYLMSVADVKNYTLAAALQYDVSYISKWVSGRMIPSEKNEKSVLDGISQCVVTSATEEGRETLLSDYQVNNLEDLQMAIYDNLEAEYLYVRDLQKNIGTSVAPKTFYYPELTLPQYVSKMRHPVLRRVKSLHVMAAMDLMEMGHEYRLQITRIENEHVPGERGYPEVHFSMLIDLEPDRWDYVYDTIFLINLLTNNTLIDFKLYGHPQAAGRVIFTVKNDFSISGMLISKDRCMAVNVSEDADNCNTLYQNIKVICSRERLLFRKTTISEMILRHDYIHTILSPHLRWLVGHMTEHFLPDDLFEEVIQMLEKNGKLQIDANVLRQIHRLMANILYQSSIQLMFYASAFSNLAVTSELDFFNHKVHLTAEQRCRLMDYVLTLTKEYSNLEIKLVYGQFVSDFEYSDNQCVFLSDAISYLRLEGIGNMSNVLIINRSDIQKIFDRSFEEFWHHCSDVVISDKEAIVSYIEHVKQGMVMLSKMTK